MKTLDIQLKKGPNLNDHIGQYLNGWKNRVQSELMERHVRSFA